MSKAHHIHHMTVNLMLSKPVTRPQARKALEVLLSQVDLQARPALVTPAGEVYAEVLRLVARGRKL